MSIKDKLLPTKTHIRASFRDAIYTNLNIGMTENYFCAFLLALGISEIVAGFELSTILLFYQKIEDHERTSIMSYITFFNITGMVIGSLSGALMMKWMPIDWNPYLSLFMISTFLRVSVVFLTPHISFKGNIPKLISYNRVFLTRAPYGALSRPIVGKIEERKPAELKPD